MASVPKYKLNADMIREVRDQPETGAGARDRFMLIAEVTQHKMDA